MEPRILQKLYLLPLVMGIGMVSGMVLCFILAAIQGHVSPYVPFISETGAELPESGIFGLFLVFGGFAGVLTMTIRYLVVYELNGRNLKKIDVANLLSLIIGYLSLGGMVVVGVYPVSTVIIAHLTGAGLFFFSGLLYTFLQTLLTYWMCPTFNGISICRIRLTISIFGLIFLVIMHIAFPIGNDLWQSNHPIAHKTPLDQGFAEIMIACLSEWLIALCLILFFFTYIREFRKIILKLDVIPLVNHFSENVNTNQMIQIL